MKIFFCGGPLKSGTTFLQRMLDSHPEISCQPENIFNDLLADFLDLRERYNRKLSNVAKTLGINPVLAKKNAFVDSFYSLIGEFFLNKPASKKISGINDNYFILRNSKPVLKFFPKAKIIYIVRNPIDTALSTWDHFYRLYYETNNPGYLNWLVTKNKKIDKEFFLYNNSQEWNKDINLILDAKADSENIKIVRYEDLIINKEINLIEILDFLGASSSKKIVQKLIDSSSLSMMKINSNNPNFYSKARLDFGAADLNQKVKRKIVASTIKNLEKLNYLNDYEEYLSR